MKPIRVIIALIGFIMLLLLLALTPWGLQLGLYTLRHTLPGQLRYQQASGLLFGPINIKQLQYNDKNIDVKINQLKIDWVAVALLYGRLHINELKASGITVDYLNRKQQPVAQPKQAQPTPQQSLPLTLQIDHAQLQHIDLLINQQQTLLIQQVKLHGKLGKKAVSLKIHVQLNQPKPMQATLTIDGTWQHYPITIGLQNQFVDWQATGIGSRQHLQLQFKQSRLLGGQASGQLQVSWGAHLRWNTQFHATRLQLNLLNPHWPTLNAVQLSSQGQYQKNLLKFNLLADIKSPQANIDVQASRTTHWQAHWKINIKKLGNWLPQSSGSLISSGRLSGTRQQPVTEGQLTVGKLQWHKLHTEKLHANWHLDFTNHKASSLHINAAQLQWASMQFKKLRVEIQGKLHQQQIIQAQFDVDQSHIQLQAKGHLQQQQWHGTLSQLQINLQKQYHWKLLKPTALILGESQLTMQHFCLTGAHQSKLCINGGWQKHAPWQISLFAQQLDINLLTQFLNIKSHATLNLTSQLIGDGLQLKTGSLQAKIGAGTIEKLPFKAISLHAKLDQQAINSQFRLQLEHHDQLKADVTVQRSANKLFDANSAVSGHLNIHIGKLQFLTKIIPYITIPKGQLQSNLILSGKIDKPLLSGGLNLINGEIDIPSINIQLKKIDIRISAVGDKVNYHGRIYSAGHAINVRGNTVLSFPDFPTTIHFTGTNILVANTEHFHIFASTDTKLTYQQHQLHITGQVIIPKAKITLLNFNNTVSLPKDQIEFVNGVKLEPKKPTQLYLKIQAKIGKQVRIDVMKARGNLTGDITFYQTPTQPINATGHILIHNGTYAIAGQVLTITPNSGLHYTKSPLVNPKIDVRAFREIKTGETLSSKKIIVGIYLRGNLLDPKATLYSMPAGLSQADILSYLVLGYVPSIGSGDTHSNSNIALLVQALSAFNFGNINPMGGIMNDIRQGLGLSELGIESSTIFSVVGNQIGQQNRFVIGKYLGKRFYLRYSIGVSSRGIDKNNKTDLLQLRYLLSEHWVVQLTTNTDTSKNGSTQLGEVGTGGDLLYTMSTN